MSFEFSYGWNQPAENHAGLLRTQQRFDLSHYRYYKVPREVDQRKHSLIEDQDGIGMCSGEMRASVVRYLLGIQNRWRKEPPRMSAMMAYVDNQRCMEPSGVGEDKGATIFSAAEASKKLGLARYELKPFDKSDESCNKYDPDVSEEARAEGLKCKTGSHSVISSYEDAIQYLGTVGVLGIGMPVGKNFQSCTGILTKQMVMADARAPEGGHALVLPHYLLPETLGLRTGERPYIGGDNSWTDQWGHHGHFYLEPEAFEYLMSLVGHGEVECVGFSHQEDFGGDPDPIDHGGDDEVIV
jgi:Papain family cysteine protease